MNRLPRFLIAAAHKSSGKTVVSTGLSAALRARGLSVAPFKKGPDYIDPMWLSLAAGRPCYNLDFNTMPEKDIRALFTDRGSQADICLIEANKGLYDGVELDGSDSNAQLAKLLQTPVILVVDTQGMTRGIAPLLQGYVNFDSDISIAGVILNKTGGPRHEEKLRRAVDEYCGIPVLGAIRKSTTLDISERHLGLITPSETPDTSQSVAALGQTISDQLDLDRIIQIAHAAPEIPAAPRPAVAPRPQGPPLRIGIARDEAFGFYYADDLEAFAAGGADLVPVDMINDPALPELDGLFIGGGFPEVRMTELSANKTMRDSVRSALEAGLPCYAECGGLMYLCKTLSWKGERHDMAGFFEGDVVMHERPQGRGYVRFRPTRSHPWRIADQKRPAHEFHYASVENLKDPTYARSILRGHGIDGLHDGLVKANTLAGFIHLRNCRSVGWVAEFLAFVADTSGRREKKTPPLRRRDGVQSKTSGLRRA